MSSKIKPTKGNLRGKKPKEKNSNNQTSHEAHLVTGAKKVVLIDAGAVNSVLENPNQHKQSAPKVADRRLARGFTITVSPPVGDYSDLPTLTVTDAHNKSETIGDRASIATADSILDELSSNEDHLPRRRSPSNTSEDRLAPEDIVPNVGLDHSISRLPSLEDMLADEELRKLLNTSHAHEQVQEMLLVESDEAKYENITSLVRRSYEDSAWRSAAAADRGLIDTLILLARQRLTSARNPHTVPGGDFMPKSSKTTSFSVSRSMYSRSYTVTSASSNEKNANLSLDPDELVVKSAMHLAILSATVRLLRNVCVDSKDCQVYLHEHRIIDLLVEHIDMIMEILYSLRDLEHSRSFSEHAHFNTLGVSDSSSQKCPSWVSEEIEGSTRALFQLIINVATGHPKIQRHILSYIFPENLFNAIILADNLDIIFSMFHCLISNQDSTYLCKIFIDDPHGLKALYFLFVVAADAQHRGETNWIDSAVFFLRNLMFRFVGNEQTHQFTLFANILQHFKKLDPAQYLSDPSRTLKHAASFKISSNVSKLYSSRRTDKNISEQWAQCVYQKISYLINKPKYQMIHTFADIAYKSFLNRISLDTLLQNMDKIVSPLKLFYRKDHIFYALLRYICVGDSHRNESEQIRPELDKSLTSAMNSVCMTLPAKEPDLDSTETLEDGNYLDLIQIAILIYYYELHIQLHTRASQDLNENESSNDVLSSNPRVNAEHQEATKTSSIERATACTEQLNDSEEKQELCNLLLCSIDTISNIIILYPEDYETLSTSVMLYYILHEAVQSIDNAKYQLQKNKISRPVKLLQDSLNQNNSVRFPYSYVLQAMKRLL